LLLHHILQSSVCKFLFFIFISAFHVLSIPLYTTLKWNKWKEAGNPDRQSHRAKHRMQQNHKQTRRKKTEQHQLNKKIHWNKLIEQPFPFIDRTLKILACSRKRTNHSKHDKSKRERLRVNTVGRQEKEEPETRSSGGSSSISSSSNHSSIIPNSVILYCSFVCFPFCYASCFPGLNDSTNILAIHFFPTILGA